MTIVRVTIVTDLAMLICVYALSNTTQGETEVQPNPTLTVVMSIGPLFIFVSLLMEIVRLPPSSKDRLALNGVLQTITIAVVMVVQLASLATDENTIDRSNNNNTLSWIVFSYCLIKAVIWGSSLINGLTTTTTRLSVLLDQPFVEIV